MGKSESEPLYGWMNGKPPAPLHVWQKSTPPLDGLVRAFPLSRTPKGRRPLREPRLVVAVRALAVEAPNLLLVACSLAIVALSQA